MGKRRKRNLQLLTPSSSSPMTSPVLTEARPDARPDARSEARLLEALPPALPSPGTPPASPPASPPAASPAPPPAPLAAFLKEGWSEGGAAARELDYYFNSYSAMGIHEEMLKDRQRTNAYYHAISMNRAAFEDAVVLDIGAGTGVLSIFAARAGARHVYAIEYSDIYDLAREIIEHNGLSDRITLIRAKAEEAELPIPANSVDIIVSEWMGYFLLYESMLDCVLVCRDKWLRPDGMILPDKARMYIAAIEDTEYKAEKFSYWDSVYGIDYSIVKSTLVAEPVIDVVAADKIISDEAMILDLDLKTATVADLEFAAPFRLRIARNDYLHAFVTWFDVVFDHRLHKPVTLTTGPRAPYTHWKQTIFYTDLALDPLPVNRDATVEGRIAIRKGAANPRTIDVKLEFAIPHKALTSLKIYHIR